MMGMPFIIPPRLWSSGRGIMIRTDARSTPPSIGGWCGSADSFDPKSIRWFQYDIQPDIFEKICGLQWDIEKRISALELLALLVAVRQWGCSIANSKFRIALHIETDSMVAKNSIQKWRAKTEPMHTILREIIITAVQHNISLFATHLPGEDNIWADAISRLKPEYMDQLNPDRRNKSYNPNEKDFWLSRGKAPWFRNSLAKQWA